MLKCKYYTHDPVNTEWEDGFFHSWHKDGSELCAIVIERSGKAILVELFWFKFDVSHLNFD